MTVSGSGPAAAAAAGPTAGGAYKPSPLGFGSARSSPFRRTESPASPSPLRFSAGGTATATAIATATATTGGMSMPTTPVSKLGKTIDHGGDGPATPPSASRESWTPRGGRISSAAGAVEPEHGASPQTPTARPAPARGGIGQANALAQLQPSQVRMLRDGFGILDRDGDGIVTKEDVVEMLTQLGLPASPASVAAFFSPSGPQTISLPAYLNTVASRLAALSPGPEMLSAFSAFDDDDSGQVDVAELRDALLSTAPDAGEPALTEAEVDRVLKEFSARRAFTKNSMSIGGGGGSGGGGGGGGGGGSGLGGMSAKRGSVFRYQDFVASVMGSTEPGSGEGPEGL